MRRLSWSLNKSRAKHGLNSRSDLRPSSRAGSRLFGRRLRVEPLEDRRMLAEITVTSAADIVQNDGFITLREAIIAANTDSIADTVEGTQGGSGADVIVFDPVVFDGSNPIVLSGSQLDSITSDLTIIGPGIDLLTIDANSSSRIFNIEPNSGDVAISGLKLTKGSAGVGSDGGAIKISATHSHTISLADLHIDGSMAVRGEPFSSTPGRMRASRLRT